MNARKFDSLVTALFLLCVAVNSLAIFLSVAGVHVWTGAVLSLLGLGFLVVAFKLRRIKPLFCLSCGAEEIGAHR